MMIPCPFCGGETGVHRALYDLRVIRWVFCESCNATGPERYTEEEAIAAWNERNGENELAARVREKEALLSITRQRIDEAVEKLRSCARNPNISTPEVFEALEILEQEE